jgi:hypothetical protein
MDEQGLSDDEISRLQEERFRQRVERVLAVMRAERVDWRGVPFLTPDGRIAVRILPMEMSSP